jgi:porphobilinogen synthase
MSLNKIRPRRLRTTKVLRNLIAEVDLNPRDLICPLFVTSSKTEEIKAMPNIFRYSIKDISRHVESLLEEGIKSYIIFGIPQSKNLQGSEAWAPDGVVQKAIRLLKENFPNILLFSDVCLCQYTSHGHCGTVLEDGTIDNDSTLENLSKISCSHAKAGVDYVAPSDMMDGRVGAIRTSLDDGGFSKVGIMAYSVKYQSSFYGPFREAADSAPSFGDRSTYQMDFRNRSEAIREIELDVLQGADIVMIKPALPYLDIIRDASNKFNVPIAAYSVSGEYSMVKAAAANGWIKEKAVTLELLTAIKRAGANMIITYFANDTQSLFS